MKNRLFFFTLLLSALFFTNTIHAQVQRPKLVVGIVIDQMRWDYLYRYNDLYTTTGFKRLLNGGHSCENTMIPYTPTVTAAGHTSLYTGTTPAIHGIVANDWVDRESGTLMYCAKDTSVMPVGSTNKNAGQMSPRNLLTNTIGDELRLATNFRSRVFGVALKDRGGIFPAGQSANAAYWFDDASGKWITSSYYKMQELPAWVTAYNNRKVPDSLLQQDWNLLFDPSKYIQSSEDDMAFEKLLESDKKRTFPHSYKSVIGSNNYDVLRASPYGTTLTFDFAKQIIRNEGLGKRSDPDMLCVSISSTDYIGHRFGPNSLEAQDMYLRLDRDLGAFLTYLDNTVGKDNYLVFLSADHGAPQNGEYLKTKNYSTAGTLSWSVLQRNLNSLCQEKFGANNIVKRIYDYQLYLDHKVTDSLKLDEKKIKVALVKYLKTIPEVWNAFDNEDFASTIMPPVIRERLSNSYYYKRSGDIQFFFKAQFTDGGKEGIEHGAWYAYDAHIPGIFYGWGIKPGKTYRETYMTDIAPTISALLKIQMPSGNIGHVITEVMK